MRLNKPPVSEEQTVLEEYVDFLLTDLSNVTPINAKSKESIQPKKKTPQVEVVPKSPKTNKAVTKSSIEKSQESLDNKANDEVVGDAKAKQDIQSETDDAFAMPAIDEIKSTKPADLTQELKTQLPFSEQEKSEAKIQLETESSSQNLDYENKTTLPNENSQKDSTSSFEHSVDDYSLEAEEEEAKKWDAVITQEKEQALLNEINLQENELSTDLSPDSLKGKERKSPPKETPDESRAVLKDLEQTLIEESITPHKEEDQRLAGVERLLARISLATKPQVKTETNLKQTEEVSSDIQQENEISQKAAQATFVHRDAEKLKDILPDVFQTLIFKVGKLPLAVPLLKLGGIVKVSSEDITPLVGTPDWFIGLVPHDRGNLMVVDTQRYLMPEQVSGSAQDMGYEYLIMLDDSNWALACNSVGDAKNLTSDDIRWSERSSKRPWFAGMVVDYMSALIEVDELINMLADTIVE